MTPPEVFGIIVRTIALLIGCWSVFYIPGCFRPDESWKRSDYASVVISRLTLSVLLIGNADRIVALAY